VSVRAALALVGALSAGACGAQGAPPGAPSRVARAQATHEHASPAPPRQSAAGSPTPLAAVDAFARAYINWTAETVSQDMQQLAAHSVGQARSAMELAAAQTAGDYELAQGGIGNVGTVEAIAPLHGQSDRYVVVTRELTTATATTAYQGLAPAWHVAVATVAWLPPGAWVVSGWQPEN
jgi:hypothetical protein